MKFFRDLDTVSMPDILLIAISLKFILFDGSIGLSIIALGITGFCGYTRYLNRQQNTWQQKIEAELERLNNKVSAAKVTDTVRRTHHAQKDAQKRWF